MSTYQEKWDAMTVEEQAEMTDNVKSLCEELLNAKDDIRLNDEYKEWIASTIIQISTKNQFYIHHFHEYCEENNLSLFDALEACIKNYKDSIKKQEDKDAELTEKTCEKVDGSNEAGT